VDNAKNKVRIFWETKYKPVSIALTTLSTAPSSPSSKAPNDFLKWLNDNDDVDPQLDEYAWYIAQPQVPGVKQGYKWWLEPT
jgi:hypothetical protein